MDWSRSRSLWVAQRSVAVIVTAASVASFAESYRALLDWAAGHGLPPFWAAVFPLMIDSFILVGELALFIAMALAWQTRRRAVAWAVTLTGVAVSVAGNVGHAWSEPVSNRVTAAVPPLAAFFGLFVGLLIVKYLTQDAVRVTGQPVTVTEQVTAEMVTTGYVPRHSDQLAAMPTASLQIRYALQITGSHQPKELAGWLAQHGHPVSVENVRTVLRRTSSNGDTPCVTSPPPPQSLAN
jgi:hypothetical protein